MSHLSRTLLPPDPPLLTLTCLGSLGVQVCSLLWNILGREKDVCSLGSRWNKLKSSQAKITLMLLGPHCASAQDPTEHSTQLCQDGIPLSTTAGWGVISKATEFLCAQMKAIHYKPLVGFYNICVVYQTSELWEIWETHVRVAREYTMKLFLSGQQSWLSNKWIKQSIPSLHGTYIFNKYQPHVLMRILYNFLHWFMH